MRELEFDGWWEGTIVYTCDQCKKTCRDFRFADEEGAKCYSTEKAHLKKNGWVFDKINGHWKDFCSDACKFAYIKANT